MNRLTSGLIGLLWAAAVMAAGFARAGLNDIPATEGSSVPDNEAPRPGAPYVGPSPWLAEKPHNPYDLGAPQDPDDIRLQPIYDYIYGVKPGSTPSTAGNPPVAAPGLAVPDAPRWPTLPMASPFAENERRSAIADEGDTALPEEMQVLGAQPAVFKIEAFGDIDVSYPERVTVDVQLLERDYARERRSGEIPAEKSRSDYYWERIAADAGKYLHASEEKSRKSFKDVNYASGTGFAISREGILLTNAHVVADQTTQELVPNLDAALSLFQTPISDALKDLEARFGNRPSEKVAPAALRGFVQWFADEGGITAEGKFTSAKVPVSYGWTTEDEREFLETRASNLKSKPILVNARVLICGKPLPGQDVAVLQLGYDTMPGFEPLPFSDRVICVSLGDSDDVLQGTRIRAMGFPGDAFAAGWMDESAAYRVSSRPGEISQIKTMAGGWDIFEMTAETNHGDSGGPVIDKQGRVVAVTVANTKLTGHKLAIPINLAKDFLEQEHITPDPGPLTQRWVAGLRLFAQGKYSEARDELEQIEMEQMRDVDCRYVSQCVTQMTSRCNAKISDRPDYGAVQH